jgi:hypothetical protein
MEVPQTRRQLHYRRCLRTNLSSLIDQLLKDASLHEHVELTISSDVVLTPHGGRPFRLTARI